MFIISILFFILLVSIIVVAPLILLGCGKLFKAPKLSFLNAMLTGIIILIVGIIIEAIAFSLHIENTFINIAFALISLALAIWVVKKKFGTNILRAIGIFLTSLVVCIIISVSVGLSTRTYAIQAFKIPSGAMLNTILIGINRLIRNRIFPGEMANAWLKHNVEEFGYLENFLPALYAENIYAGLKEIDTEK